MHNNGQTSPSNLFSATEITSVSEVSLKYREALAAKIPKVTPTELTVGVLLALSYDTKQIAVKLRMDIRSIDNHRYHIRKKMGLKRQDNLQAHLLRLVARIY